MTKERRVGTITVGLSLVAFGILFLIRNFIPGLDYYTILSLWPFVLISMGAEILMYRFFSDELQLRMDGGAIFLLFMLGVFSFTMAVFEFVAEYMKVVI